MLNVASKSEKEPRAAANDAAPAGKFPTEPEKSGPVGADLAARVEKMAATFGHAVGLLMRSPQHKHYSLADLEWLLVPPLLTNQFTLLSGKPKDGPDVAVPIGLALWARVSEEVDEKLSANLSHPLKFRPDEWASGDIHWLIDVVGPAEAAKIMVAQLRQGALKGRAFKMRVRDKAGKVEVREMAPDGENSPEASGAEA